jgi:hypothetical protein
MKIIESNAIQNPTVEVLSKIAQSGVYPISNNIVEYVKSSLLTGRTAVLFSGVWRFDLDAVYIENKNFKSLNWTHSYNQVYFVNVSKTELIGKFLQKNKIVNVLILHSAEWCQYRHIEQITQSAECYLDIAQQIIITVPNIRTDFNRLKYSCQDIAQKYSAEYIEDSFIIKRNRQLSKQA